MKYCPIIKKECMGEDCMFFRKTMYNGEKYIFCGYSDYAPHIKVGEIKEENTDDTTKN